MPKKIEEIPEVSKDTRLLDIIYSLKKVRENYEPMFYLSRKAYEGKHFVAWNRSLQTLTELPGNRSMMNQLPEVAKQTDAFENFLLSTDFTFTLIPTKLSDDASLEDSMNLSLLAQDYYNKLKDSTILSDYIHFALLDNVSFIEVSPNDANTDVECRMFDGFDILFDPRIRDWGKQTLVVKVIRKTKTQLENSKLYNISKGVSSVSGTPFFSWKDVYESEKYASFATLNQDEYLLFECYIKTAKGLRVVTIDGAANVLRNDLYESVKGIPIIPLRIYSGEWYQPSYAYRLIPLNRSIDIISNRMEDLILRLAKGGWLVQNEENLNSRMNEENGQVIKYESVKPTQIEMPSVPNFIFEWFQNTINLSERYGLSSVMSGNMPMNSSNLRANSMLESITGQTMRNNTAVISNMRASIKSILEYTFAFLYEMWDTPQDVLFTDFSQSSPRFISEKFGDFSDTSVVKIPSSFKRFEVTIDDAFGYTLGERKKSAIELNKLGVISGETLKKIFKLGSSAYLVEAEDKPMYQTKEFQLLMKAFPTMSVEQKQSVINTLNALGGQVGNQELPDSVKSLLNTPGKTTPGAQGAQPSAPATVPAPQEVSTAGQEGM